jgi:hypothetical protein
MWRLASAFVAVATTALIAATATEAAPLSAAANVRTQANDVGGENSLVTQVRLTPRGFSHGRKVGWHGRHHPPGWGEGRKVGWHHASVPPGLRR